MRNKLTNEQNYLLWERGWTLQWVNLLSSNRAAQRPASRPALLCRHIFLQHHFLSPDWWLGGCWWQFKKYICVCVHAQLSLTLCDSTDWSPPGPSVHGILQARILQRVDISSSRVSSQPRDWTCISCVSCIGRQILYTLCHLGSPLKYM